MEELFRTVSNQINFYIWFLLLLYQVIVGSYASWTIRTGVVVHGLPETQNRVYEESYSPSLCHYGTQCTSLERCRLLRDLMEHSCLLPSRLGEITCGYRGTQPMVCCPGTGFDSPWSMQDNDGNTPGPRPGRDPNFMINEDNCGMAKSTQGLGAYPFVARVGYINTKKNTVDYPCLGSIISRKVILTAAHCVMNNVPNFELFNIIVGDWDTSTERDCSNDFCALEVQRVDISHVIVHPDFQTKTFKSDIALVILKAPINYTVAAQPLCLMENDNINLVGKKLNLVGWGTVSGKKERSKIQQVLQTTVVPLEKCVRLFQTIFPISERQMCAGGDADKDPCQGFGGGPLIVLDRSQPLAGSITGGKFYQSGIASFGSDECGKEGVPGVYTKISSYIEWIKENIGNAPRNL